jgi:RimJ/RimL family protein N-acetyltransferase
MSAETLETARLTLRAPARSDAARLAKLANDADVARMTTRIPHPYGLTDAEAFLERCGGLDQGMFAIEHGDDGLIGMIGFQQMDAPDALGPEVGYWIGRPYWGKGLATEATAAVLQWAGRDWGRRCVFSSHFADNPASGAVLIKAGFLYTGQVEKRPSAARGGQAVDSRMMVWLA